MDAVGVWDYEEAPILVHELPASKRPAACLIWKIC